MRYTIIQKHDTKEAVSNHAIQTMYSLVYVFSPCWLEVQVADESCRHRYERAS